MNLVIKQSLLIKTMIAMRSYLITLFALILLSTSVYAQSDWTHLFGSDTSTWTTLGQAKWTLDGEVLTGDEMSGLGFAVSKKSYKNFHLKLEFKPNTDVNSGVFFRCSTDSIAPTVCYEANIWDDHVNQDFRTGAVVLQASPLVKVQTVDKWNTYEIFADEDHIQLWVNGLKTADFKSDLSQEGIIALQLFKQGQIQFRNVKIKEL